MGPIERLRLLRQRFGPRTADLAAIGLMGMIALIAVFAGPRKWVDLPVPILAVSGAVGTAALWWRRRWPELVTIIGLAVFLLTGNPVGAAIGLFTVALVRRDRVLLALTAVSAVVFALPTFIDAGRFDVGGQASGVFEALLIIAIGAYLGARRDLLASLRERAETAESQRELRDEQARAAERARIAREMHDVLAHKVSLIALHAGALEVNADAGPDRVEESAALIRSTAHQTLEELREVLGVLRSDGVPDDTDLVPTATAPDIGQLVETSRRAGLPIEMPAEIPDLSEVTARAVHRIVQEALTNVHKHARGAATEVTVAGDEAHGVRVAVVNRRPVAASLIAEPVPGSGAGLVGLGERVRLLGGSFGSGPERDGGWAVRAWLPWGASAPEPAPESRPVGVEGQRS